MGAVRTYNKEEIFQILKNTNDITLLHVWMTSDKTVLRILAETYIYEDLTVCTKTDSLNIICKEGLKKNKACLKRYGLTHETIESDGLDISEWSKLLSDYFIQHEGVIFTYDAAATSRALNDKLDSEHMRIITNIVYDIKRFTKFYQEEFSQEYSLKNLKNMLKSCLKKMQKLEIASKNKIPCTVMYAYCFDYGQVKQAENNTYKNTYLFRCVTSLGNLIYDNINQAWKMPKSESKKNGILIENIDTRDIENQLFEKYKVSDMKELKEKLIKKNKQKREVC